MRSQQTFITTAVFVLLASGCGPTLAPPSVAGPCQANNGGCGDPKYFSCTASDTGFVDCADIDECSVDNGGCGEPSLFTCNNQVGADPTCTPRNGDGNDAGPTPPGTDAGPVNPPAPPAVDAGPGTPDAGPPLPPDNSCGQVTLQGQCEGSVLAYCDASNQITRIDCATEYFPADVVGGSCVLISNEYGFDCAAPTGESCLYQDPNGQPMPTFCANATDGCVADVNGTDGFTCRPGIPSCSASAASQSATCQGDLLYLSCLPGDQPLAFDCSSNGGTCADGACQAPIGESCDGIVIQCGDGLTCDGATQTTNGTCIDVDECQDNNGGCGDPGLFACTNQVGAAPICTSIQPPAPSCDGITTKGLCDGSVLKFCSGSDELITVDCATEYFPSGENGGRCIQVSDEYGYDCALPNGGACVYAAPGGELVTTFCAEPEAACGLDLMQDGGFACTADVGTCQPAAAGETFAATCEGNFLFLDCQPGGQPVGYDCASNGGTCQNGACQSPPSEICDDESIGCQPGYECVGVSADAFGTCVDVDLCATNNGGCGDPRFVECVDQVAAPPNCVDIAECQTNNGGCGDPTFWRCTEQFGAAPLCTDLNECQTNNGGCGDPNLFTCTNREGAAPLCRDIASGQTQICDGLTSKGQCDGDILGYCGNNGVSIFIDCRSEYFPAEYTTGSCQIIDSDYGYDCVLPAGEPCVFDTGLSEIPTYCESPNAGCVWDFANTEGFLCTETAPACTQPAAGETFTPQCSGDLLLLDCLPGDQPLAYDCGSLGGGCENGACRSPQTELCDDELLRCAAGTRCEGVTATQFGTCVAVNDCGLNNGGCGDPAQVQCVVENGANACVDVDECADNNGGCGDANLVRCINRESATPLCEDIDECAENNGGCGDAAFVRCNNQFGAAPLCEDVDECAVNNGGCGDPALYRCTDQAGRRPLCQDINTGVSAICEGITERGQCDGDILSYCDGNNLRVTIDCPTEYLPAVGTGATCRLVDDNFGYDCAFPTGETCLYDAGTDLVQLNCSDAGDGCVVDITNNQGFVCTENMPLCTVPAANELFTPVCDGDFLFVDCLAGQQPLGYNCAANNGVCENSTCRVGQNALCDDAAFVCDAGFVCQGLTVDFYGQCTALP